MSILGQSMEQFPMASADAWKAKIEKELKGKNFNELIWHSEEDIAILPFYTDDILKSNCLNAIPFRKGNAKAVAIILADEINDAQQIAHQELQLGVDAIFYTSKKQVFTDHEKQELTKAIDTSIIDVVFLEKQHVIQISEKSTITEELADAIIQLTNLEITDSPIYFQFPIHPNFFFDIAKWRAFRWLIQQVQEANSINLNYFIVAKTGTSRRADEFIYNNMLRNTTETMSAILGGVDYVFVLPHEENSEGKRIARNIMPILKYESYFENLPDMGKGSYYIEYLTYQLAQKAWKKIRLSLATK